MYVKMPNANNSQGNPGKKYGGQGMLYGEIFELSLWGRGDKWNLNRGWNHIYFVGIILMPITMSLPDA